MICFNYRYEYQWCDTDSVKYKRPTALPAPKYISLLMDWVESQINDANIFPLKVGELSPLNYQHLNVSHY